MNVFKSVQKKLERRHRLIQGLAAMSWALLLALGFTALLLILGSVQLLPKISLAVWVSAHVLVGGLAFGVGWLRPFERADMFFRADQNLHTHELLVTLYELSMGSGPQEFFPVLEKRLERLALDGAKALPIAQTDRWRWGGVLVLALLCVGMTNVPGMPVWQESEQTATSPEGSAPSPSREPGLAEWLQRPPADLPERLASLRERFEQVRAALALNPNDPRARAALQQLYAEISQEQGRLTLPPPGEVPQTPEPSRQDASLAQGSAGNLQPPPKGESSPNDTAQLDQLLRSLQDIQGQAHDLSPEELQKLLDQVREGNPSLESLLGAALQPVRSREEFRKKLEELIKNLEERQRLSEELKDLQRQVQSALSQSEPQTAHPDQPQSSRDTQSAQVKSPSPNPHENSQTSAGYGKAPLDQEAAQDLPNLSQWRERTRSLPVPGPQDKELEILFEILTMGLPQGTNAPEHSAPIQIDYQRVEALLETLEIPSELREPVRRYFLSLAQR